MPESVGGMMLMDYVKRCVGEFMCLFGHHGIVKHYGRFGDEPGFYCCTRCWSSWEEEKEADK